MRWRRNSAPFHQLARKTFSAIYCRMLENCNTTVKKTAPHLTLNKLCSQQRNLIFGVFTAIVSAVLPEATKSGTFHLKLVFQTLLVINPWCCKRFMCLVKPNKGFQLSKAVLWLPVRFLYDEQNEFFFFVLFFFLRFPVQTFVWHDGSLKYCGEKTLRSYPHKFSQTRD